MDNENTIMEDVKAVRKETTLEKHIQTILLSVITVAIVGGFNKIGNISDSLIRMEEREKTKTEQINNMQIVINKMHTDIYELKDKVTRLEIKTKK